MKRYASYIRVANLLVLGSVLVLLARILMPESKNFLVMYYLILAFSLLMEIFWMIAPRLSRWWHRLGHRNYVDENIRLYTPQYALFEHRSHLRTFDCFLVVVLSWGFAFVGNPTTELATSLILLIYFFGFLFLFWFEYEAIANFHWGQPLGVWAIVAAIVSVMSGFIARKLFGNWPATIVLVTFGGGITITMHVIQRLSVGNQAWSEVIRDLSVWLLGVRDTQQQWSKIVKIIHKQLRYEHVYILEPMPENPSELHIAAEYGGRHSVKGASFSSELGITGQAYHRREIVAWNDVNDCPYYHAAREGEIDTIRAEIAVPIRYRNEVFGILDVQSESDMVFGPGDIRSLEVIGRILGVAMSAQKTDLLLTEATKLWERLAGELSTKEEVFNSIAQFAHDDLGADLVVFYPLSPAGYPIARPSLFSGKFYAEERMHEPLRDFRGPLFKLIKDWKAVFQETITKDHFLAHPETNFPPSFVEREGIQSVCFIPIGTKEEKLGVVFVNYRTYKQFDSLYRLMVLGFSQALTALASKESYREAIFEGFGRPDLGIHNIQARYGFKDGVMQEGRFAYEQCTATAEGSPNFRECEMYELLKTMDKFLAEVRAQTTVDDLPWQVTLREAIREFISKMKEQTHQEHLWFVEDLDPMVERESYLTRLAIFRVLTEAVNNGVFHGGATKIEIKLERRSHSIYVRVVNNGEAIDPKADRNRSRGGIFAQMDELKSRFAATTSIRADANGQGTIVESEMPALPLSEETV